MNLIKKTNTTKLSMNDKVKKAFKTYCKVIIFGTCFAVSTTTAFAANDPITVVNNLSDFIFNFWIRFLVTTCWRCLNDLPFIFIRRCN